MSTRFVSDLHLNDLYMYGWRSRELSVRDYSALIVQNWNQTVASTDKVIIAGDIGTKCQDTVNVLRALSGNKILILGNHDVEWGPDLYALRIFSGIYRTAIIDDVFVSHEPVTDKAAFGAAYRVHGHHHSYQPLAMRSQFEHYARDKGRFNCCIDLNGMRPRTLQELMMYKAMLVERKCR